MIKKVSGFLGVMMVAALLVFSLSACNSGGGGGGGGGGGHHPPPAVNHAPAITSLPGTTVIANQLYIYDVLATDADGDTLAYSLDIFPTGMTIAVTSGVVNWTPSLGQVGDHVVKVKVSDGTTAIFQQYTLAVSVPPPNRAPTITSTPGTLAISSLVYSYVVIASDLDADVLTYSLVTFPTGMNIDSISGQITWTPTLGQVGNHWLDISVSDGETSSHQLYVIRVSPSDDGIPFQRGCVLTSWWYNDYEQTKSLRTIDLMKANGCDSVAILVTWYQDTISSTTIYSVFSKTPSDSGLIKVINYAHTLGMTVWLKPHVDVMSGAWRGNITFANEADWAAWFTSYNTFISHYLDLAAAHNVDGFVIGTEFKAAEARESDWRNTISLGRSKFSGLMSYSANHDSYAAVNWWDALDFIGVDAYFPLTASYSPTVPELVAAWTPWKNDLSAFAALWNKDIVFLEIGYQSNNGTNVTPWWTNGGADLQEQSDCYEAAFQALFSEPWFKGMYWWMWYWDPSQNVNGFDVYNKPAEDNLRWWYAGN